MPVHAKAAAVHHGEAEMDDGGERARDSARLQGGVGRHGTWGYRGRSSPADRTLDVKPARLTVAGFVCVSNPTA